MELKQFTSLEYGYVRQLLIVPYGIETVQAGRCALAGETFNCTLWN